MELDYNTIAKANKVRIEFDGENSWEGRIGSDSQGTLYLAVDDHTKLVIIPGQDFAQENGEITGFTVVD